MGYLPNSYDRYSKQLEAGQPKPWSGLSWEAVSVAVYFRLANDCRLVTGALKSAVYHLGTGDIISLGLGHSRLLLACEDNLPISEALAKSGARMNEDEAGEFLGQLVSSAMGIVGAAPFYVEEYEPIREFSLPGVTEPAVEVDTAYLEIDGECNVGCAHCSVGWQYRYACNSCLPWRLGNATVAHDETYRQVIFDLGKMRCRRLVLSGGDPLAKPDLLRTLCSAAFSSGIKEILAITSGIRLLNESCKELIASRVIHPVICLLGPDSETYRYRTGSDDAFLQVYHGLSWMEENALSYSICLTVYTDGSTVASARRDFAALLDSLRPAATYLVEVCQEQHFGEGFLLGKERIPRINVYDFYRKRRYHPCIGHTVAIARDGKVHPCPRMTRYVVGSVTDTSLRDILCQQDIMTFWHLTKDNISPCLACEYRYACYDCRAAELTANDYKEMIHCKYDPYKGQWQG